MESGVAGLEEILGQLLAEPVRRWLEGHGFGEYADQAGLIAAVAGVALVALGGTTLSLLASTTRRAFRYVQTRALAADLHPYFTHQEVERATRYFVPSQFQSVSPAAEEEPGHTSVAAARQPLIPWMIENAFRHGKDDHRFYVVLGGAGMGKTTLLINLYLRYRQKWSWPWRRRYAIVLFPLGYPNLLEKIRAVEDPHHTLLLLDAFDEDPVAVKDYKARLAELLSAAKEFREVVITCRTHFFPSEDEEPRETGVLRFGGEKGEHVFTKLYLSPFNDADVKRYLQRRYPFFRLRKRWSARRVVRLSPNLMVRPMLLAHIEDLQAREKPYQYTFQIYETLIDRWIAREARRQGHRHQDEFAANLRKLSTELAVDLYRHRARRGALHLPADELGSFASSHGINLSEIDVRSRSLLNRTARGDYKFAHKSILEYLLAELAWQDDDFVGELAFEGMDAARRFCVEFVLHGHDLELLCRVGSGDEVDRGVLYPLRLLFSAKADPGAFTAEKRQWSRNLPRGWRDARDWSIIELPEECHGLAIRLLPELLPSPQRLRSLRVMVNGELELEAVCSFRSLQALDISGSAIDNVAPLAKLKGLRALDIGATNVSDLQPLASLSELDHFQASSCEFVQDLGGLGPLRQLLVLTLAHTAVRDLTPLAHHHALQALDLSSTKTEAVASLEGLSELQFLSLHDTPVSDVSPLLRLDRLEHLELGRSRITHLPPLSGLVRLKALGISRTAVEDLAPLAGAGRLLGLDIRGTPVDHLSALAELRGLQHLRASATKIADLEPLRQLANLERLELDGTAITTLDPLRGLHLAALSLTGTAVSDLRPLADMHTLAELSLDDTQVTSLLPLASLALRHLSIKRAPLSETEITRFRARVPQCKIVVSSSDAPKDPQLH